MQRCPQCEFIYEDDQSRCDMDGAELVHDSHPLPRLQALAVTAASEVTPKSTWRRVVPFAAALVLAIVMALVYYVSVSRSSRAASTAGITTAETPATISEPSPTTPISGPASQETKNETPAEKSSDGADAKKAESPSADKPANDRTKSTPRAQSNNQPRSKTEPAEKESKVRSALKKTGRFFKRVF